jgi:hypothetical protein
MESGSKRPQPAMAIILKGILEQAFWLREMPFFTRLLKEKIRDV